MNNTEISSAGTLKVSENVIVTVARLAALDVKGVAGLKTQKCNALGKDNSISVTHIGDVAAIEIFIKVKNGFKATKVAQEVQNTVKENIQSMTGITAARVNVVVDGIEFD
ncbi:MAG: Asp23/Gls24 family envelope stress response protein [Ruminococcus sp.]|jgi:uncharacterized alkaline shock family protein YloU|nr:Asp23/Gls24 family envelope stress response protein [Ruminococcus sp.]